MPLLVMLLPFQHDGEGATLPVVFSFPFLMRQRGACPSSSCCCHFNTTGRVLALPIIFSFPL